MTVAVYKEDFEQATRVLTQGGYSYLPVLFAHAIAEERERCALLVEGHSPELAKQIRDR